jgi:hypothetical protein
VLNGTIQLFPSFSLIIAVALETLDRQMPGSDRPASYDARSDGYGHIRRPYRQD